MPYLTFGPHRGAPVEYVPSAYLRELVAIGKQPSAWMAEDELKRREGLNLKDIEG